MEKRTGGLSPGALEFRCVYSCARARVLFAYSDQI